MSPMESPWVRLPGWLAFHFAWQACLIAGALLLAQVLLRRAPASGRYAVAVLALMLCVACGALTLGRFLHGLDWTTGELEVPVTAVTLVDDQLLSVQRAQSWVPVVRIRLDDEQSRWAKGLASGAGVLWVIGSIMLAWRMRRGWSVTLRRVGEATPASNALKMTLEKQASRLRIRSAPPLLTSRRVASPMVIGVLTPAIVVPDTIEERFSMDEIEALFIHELAHLKRFDPWQNLGQCVCEVSLFWHPAVLWISRCIRHEREMCCDAHAIGDGRGMELAEALVRLQEAHDSLGDAVLYANRGSLLARIQALVDEPGRPQSRLLPRLAFCFATMPLTLLAAFNTGTAMRPLLEDDNPKPAREHTPRVRLQIPAQATNSEAVSMNPNVMRR